MEVPYMKKPFGEYMKDQILSWYTPMLFLCNGC